MYAIQNIKTGKYVYGTCFGYWPNLGKNRQRTSKDEMLTYATAWQAQIDFKKRRCGKDYRIVVLKTIEVKRVTDLHQQPIDIWG